MQNGQAHQDQGSRTDPESERDGKTKPINERLAGLFGLIAAALLGFATLAYDIWLHIPSACFTFAATAALGLAGVFHWGRSRRVWWYFGVAMTVGFLACAIFIAIQGQSGPRESPGHTPRRLAGDRLTAFIAALQDCPPCRVNVASIAQDPESATFGNDIATAIRALSPAWKVTSSSDILARIPPQGLFIAVTEAAKAPPCAARLQQAFKVAGFNAIGEETHGPDNDAIEIFVGTNHE
ncbi:MAG TPA: hypothetical protein VI756_24040 [Blastocatellia bacterium]